MFSQELFLQELVMGGTAWAIISALATALSVVSGVYNKLLWDRAKRAEERCDLLDTRIHDLQKGHLEDALEQQKALHTAIATLEGNEGCAQAIQILQRLEVKVDGITRLAEHPRIQPPTAPTG